MVQTGPLSNPSPIDKRRETLKYLVDFMIEKGMPTATFAKNDHNLHLCSRDVDLIQDYCNSLGYEASFFTSRENEGFIELTTMPSNPLPEEEISISLEDYNLLKFCRQNPLVRLLYKLYG